MFRSAGVSAIAVAVMICGGCAEFEKPSAAVSSVSLGKIDPQGFTMNVMVDVKNPNAVAIPLAEVDYALAMSGSEFLKGQAAPGGSVPKSGQRTVALPVQVSFENLLTVSDAIARSGGKIPYKIDAGIGFTQESIPLLKEKVRVPVSYSGMLDVREVLNDPMLLLRSPAARKLAEQALGSVFGR